MQFLNLLKNNRSLKYSGKWVTFKSIYINLKYIMVFTERQVNKESLKTESLDFRPLIMTINDIELFIDRMEKRKGDLEELKDDILIYSDREFMDSLKRAEEDVKEGRVKQFKDKKEFDEYFEKLLK